MLLINARSLLPSLDLWSLICDFSLQLQGIPIIYYGTEQAFDGGNDPNNRESLWPHYDVNFDLYKYISTLANYRQKLGSAVYQSQQVERYVDDQFFAFTRDKVYIRALLG